MEQPPPLRKGQFTIRGLFALTTCVALVCGLLTWQGYVAAYVLIFNGAVARVAMGVEREKRNVAAASLFAMFAGCSVALTIFVVMRAQVDVAFVLGVSTSVAFAYWLLMVLPVIVWVRTNLLSKCVTATLLCGALAMLTFAMSSNSPTRQLCFVAAFAGMGGLLIPRLARSRLPSLVLLWTPSAAFFLFLCIVWPTLEFLAPSLTYTYGSRDSKLRSLHRIVQTVRVGDSLDELCQAYPMLFAPDMSSLRQLVDSRRYEMYIEIRIDPSTRRVRRVTSEFVERAKPLPAD
jgi:hypothetical protein